VVKSPLIAKRQKVSGNALPTLRFGKAEQKIESKNEK
jgi:hypothetical protein